MMKKNTTAQMELVALRARVAELEGQLAASLPTQAPGEPTPAAAPLPGEARYYSAFDPMLEGAQFINHDWVYVYVNPAAERHNRRPNQALLGKRYMDCWPGIENTHVFEVIRRCLEERIPTQMDNFFVYPDGVEGWFQLSIQPVPEGVLILSIDITERKQAEVALQESKDRFSKVFYDSPAPMMIAELETGKLIEVNTAYEHLVGYTAAEVIGHSPIEFDIFPEPAQLAQAQKQFNERGGLQGIEFTLRRKNGEIRQILVWSSVLTLNNKMVINLGTALDVTELKMAEIAQKESEAKYSVLFEKAALPATLTALPEMVFVDANEAFTKAFGYTRAEVLGKTSLELGMVRPNEQRRTINAIQEKGYALDDEKHLMTKAGEERIIWVNASRVEVGGKSYSVTTINDVTERKRAENLAREQANLLEFAHDAIFVLDMYSHITYWNKGAVEQYGWSKAEALGKVAHQMLKTAFPIPYEQVIEELLQTGRWEGELTHSRRDDSKVIMASRWQIQYDEAGQPAAILEFNNDITERKCVEQSEKKLMERLDLATRAARMGIWDWDIQHNDLAWDDLMYSLYGLKPGEFQGAFEAWLNGLHPDDRAASEQVSQRAVRGEQPYDTEFRIVWPDGTVRWLKADGQVFYDQNHVPLRMVGVNYDITERKQAEDELRRTMEELQRSNAELEQFAYVASHDLQEPLRVVAGMVQLLQHRYQGRLDGSADEYIAHAVDAANRMQALINDLLAYSRVDRYGKAMKPVEANAVLDSALDNLQVAIQESGAQITSAGLPTVMADPLQLVQLFQNLVGNAIKFQGKEAPKIDIRAEKLADAYQFVVSDNGIGIESQYYERIFLVFQRLHTRRDYPGTGIGLALCKKIIERHGGKIWVESQPGSGSSFYFTLPILNKDH